MLKITDAGGLYILNCLFNGNTLPSQLRLALCTAALAFADSGGNDFVTADAGKLFSTTTSPVDGNGDPSISEVNGPGYSSRLVTAAENAVSLAAGGIPEAAWDEQLFTFTSQLNGGATIYGYQIIAVASGDGNPILFEGLIANPYKPPLLGGTLKLTPKIQFGNGTPT